MPQTTAAAVRALTMSIAAAANGSALSPVFGEDERSPSRRFMTVSALAIGLVAAASE